MRLGALREAAKNNVTKLTSSQAQLAFLAFQP